MKLHKLDFVSGIEMNKIDWDGFDRHVPLVFDLDGTLIKTNTAHDSFYDALFHSPQRLLGTMPSWCKGRAVLKKIMANCIGTKPQR
ncbi:hypothetical protein BPNPMPFG_007654 (plasmid) [Mesorhizobium sp. AR07]|uniref:hypothetical protein n=1 Tax=Mesorhizobium sp. AR07 TaxID=2865838 RepID=UPI0021601AB5|nr:hypothetical protein [Mesorhizobium sp. AR07]UVK48039.1 hypothetical protein BPNPMPFG_007654 [Mesorhizobium sp. AR07]